MQDVDKGLVVLRGGSGKTGGFTLIEVVMSLAILVMVILSLLYTTMGVTKLNKVTQLGIAGSNAVTSQLNFLASTAGNAAMIKLSEGAAKAVVSYLSSLHDGVHGKTNYPIKVDLVQEAGYAAIVYEFLVVDPGMMTRDISEGDGVVEGTQYALGRGVVEVHLDERLVPAEFLQFDDLQYTGDTTPDVHAPVILPGFDMNQDNDVTDTFVNLFRGSKAEYKASGLASLPLTVTVRYYATEDQLNADLRDPGGAVPGFKRNSDQSLVNITRNFIINGSSIIIPD